ncbi:MAG: serine/threonine protein kinase, partial [bacterium]|nr:serine/threonine protein kinase [bacterium]
ENALLRCLDKSRMNRPNTARELAQAIERSPAAHKWTLEEGELWWGRHQRGRPKVVDNASNSDDPTKGDQSDQTFDQTMDFS